MFDKLKIRTSLFIASASVVTFTTLVLVTYFSLWGAQRLRSDTVTRLGDSVRSLAASLDESIGVMDRISLSVLYSNLVKARVAEYSRESGLRGLTPYPGMGVDSKDAALIDLLFAIMGPSTPVRQINIYDLRGKGFGVGMDNRPRSVDPETTDWFRRALAAGGMKVLSDPRPDPTLARYLSSRPASGEKFISLARLIFDAYSTPIGVVEVEQSFDAIFKPALFRTAPAAEDELTRVSDGSGRILFPLPGAETPAGPRRTSRSLIAKSAESEVSGWRVEVLVDEVAVLAPLRRFVASSCLLSAIILGISLAVAYVLAGRITKPVRLLHRRISGFDPDNPERETEASGRGYSELSELDTAFTRMGTELRKSVRARMAATREEAKSHMLALQAQMNPHFLYNTIATISALAEDGAPGQAVELCGHLSDMLRYISSQESAFVPAGRELDHVRRYLDCLVTRWGDKLKLAMTGPAAFEEVRIPKLVIQPLVENCSKYATTGEPPWSVCIETALSCGIWRVRVSDNGPGFSGEAMDRVRKLVEETTASSRGLELDGMGLANIACRLSLCYGEEAVFDFDNDPGTGGAWVEVGGPVREPVGEEAMPAEGHGHG